MGKEPPLLQRLKGMTASDRAAWSAVFIAVLGLGWNVWQEIRIGQETYESRVREIRADLTEANNTLILAVGSSEILDLNPHFATWSSRFSIILDVADDLGLAPEALSDILMSSCEIGSMMAYGVNENGVLRMSGLHERCVA